MAGIAAFFGRGQTALSELADGLSPRGHDTAVWQEGRLGLVTRAELPMVHTRGGLAAVVEGVPETSRLLAEYAKHGADALVRSGDPYVIAVADPVRDAMLLARAGDGPALYYAVLGKLVKPDPDTGGDGFRAWAEPTGCQVLAAAEPAALLAAGASAQPDPEVVRRFVETGRCDESDVTFFPAVRRLLPGQVVEVTGAGVRVRTLRTDAAHATPPLPDVVAEAVRHGPVGIRLADTMDSADLLAAVLSDRSVRRPVQAYQPLYVDPDGARAEPLNGLGVADTQDAVRRIPVLLSAARLVADLPAFLTDIGEPVPDLASYELWASARTCMGDVNTLLDPSGARGGNHLGRVADRVAARYGVSVRLPVATGAGRQVGRTGAGHGGEDALLADVLNEIKDRVYATFLGDAFHGRPWVRANVALRRFDAFLAGRGRHDPGWFWRLYLVEQWLRGFADRRSEGIAPVSRETFGAHPGGQVETTVERRRWLRFPVRTNRFVPGDQVARKVAGYATELVVAARRQPAFRDVFAHPWYLVVAEKPVAVAQGRSHLLWRIRPGWWARGLARVASRAPYRAGSRSAWALDLAMREVGRWRMLYAVLAGLVGRLFGRADWYDMVAGPSVTEIVGPRTDALYPANLSVSLGAANADQVAEEIVTALRSALPSDAAGCLSGCAVLAAGDERCQVRGLWGDGTAEFYQAAFADNPLGQGVEQTPIAVVVAGSAVRRPKRGKARTKRRQPARSR